MIKEIVEFTKSVADSLKDFRPKPKVGLHILLNLEDKNDSWYLDTQNHQYERYTFLGKESDFLNRCAEMQQSAWYIIELEKSFDLPEKAIHSCSPLCVGFKKTYLKGGERFNKNQEATEKSQIYGRFGRYFDKAFSYLESDNDKEKYKIFRAFFKEKQGEYPFEQVLEAIFQEQEFKKKNILEQIELLQKEEENNSISKQIETLEREAQIYEPLDDNEYIIFYLNENLSFYKSFHEKVEQEKLFNYPNKHNIQKEKETHGVSTFFHSHNAHMPFLINRAAPFDIPGRVSLNEAKQLATFRKMLISKQKILPNPLPIFISKAELSQEMVQLYNSNEKVFGYEEIINQLWKEHQDDFGNYYLIFWQKVGHDLEFNDVDYISSFDYLLQDVDGSPWLIEDVFSAEKNNPNYVIENLFDFQYKVLPTIFNDDLVKKTGNYWTYKYFGKVEKKTCDSSPNYQLVLKYRKAFYDFVYKSQKHLITPEIFSEIILTNIISDIRKDKFDHKKQTHSRGKAIRQKLNVWFSLYKNFTLNLKQQPMTNQLKKNQEFVAGYLAGNIDAHEASEENFAFAIGQMAYYLMSKSKSADESYRRLERHFQQSSLEGFVNVLKDDFIRYKHQNYTKKFRKIASWVFADCPKNESIDKYTFQILAGLFSENQLFHDKA